MYIFSSNQNGVTLVILLHMSGDHKMAVKSFHIKNRWGKNVLEIHVLNAEN